jgi:hypothetical protein
MFVSIARERGLAQVPQVCFHTPQTASFLKPGAKEVSEMRINNDLSEQPRGDGYNYSRLVLDVPGGYVVVEIDSTIVRATIHKGAPSHRNRPIRDTWITQSELKEPK